MVGREVYRTRHRYAEYSEEIELVFFSVALAAGSDSSIRNLAFERTEWARPAELSRYGFLPADRELIARLASGELRLS